MRERLVLALVHCSILVASSFRLCFEVSTSVYLGGRRCPRGAAPPKHLEMWLSVVWPFAVPWSLTPASVNSVDEELEISAVVHDRLEELQRQHHELRRRHEALKTRYEALRSVAGTLKSAVAVEVAENAMPTGDQSHLRCSFVIVRRPHAFFLIRDMFFMRCNPRHTAA